MAPFNWYKTGAYADQILPNLIGCRINEPVKFGDVICVNREVNRVYKRWGRVHNGTPLFTWGAADSLVLRLIHIPLTTWRQGASTQLNSDIPTGIAI